MKKIILTRGLPGSGKTTWALDYIKENSNTKRINKDDLRNMVDGGGWSSNREKIIIRARDVLVKLYLDLGFNVIIDDTNLVEKHFVQMAGIAAKYKDVIVEVKDFTDVPIEECIKNDLARVKSVGKDVIMDMYNKHLKESIIEPEYNYNLQDCIIVDIDGTLAHMTNRTAYEWDKVGSDKLDVEISTIIRTYEESEPVEIILVSGRSDGCRQQTEQWLKDKHVKYDELYMRKKGDMRKDVEVKTEIYNKYIKNNYNVIFVLDDRKQTVEGWRNLGLKCLQVAEGNF